MDSDPFDDDYAFPKHEETKDDSDANQQGSPGYNQTDLHSDIKQGIIKKGVTIIQSKDRN